MADSDHITYKIKLSRASDHAWLRHIIITAYSGSDFPDDEIIDSPDQQVMWKNEITDEDFDAILREDSDYESEPQSDLEDSETDSETYDETSDDDMNTEMPDRAEYTRGDSMEHGMASSDEKEHGQKNAKGEKRALEDKKSKVMNKGVEVGKLVADLIRRPAIRADFHQSMEEPKQGTCELGLEVFDRYGFLKQAFVTGSRKGSGVFGDELGQGNILHVEHIRVEDAWQRKGVGKAMVRKLIQKTRAIDKATTFAFAWPTILNERGIRDLPKDEYVKTAEIATATSTALFRSVGYRRVGDSAWFCFAFDSSHASRKMPSEDDFNVEGELTELAKLERELEEKRISTPFGLMTLCTSDKFRGHPDDAVSKLLELRGIQKPWPQDLLTRTKYGCTCGMCLGGFMSPRMCHALLFQAEVNGDTLKDELAINNPDFFGDHLWENIPEPAYSNMYTNKSMRMGFAKFFCHAAACLRGKRCPTIINILRVQADDREWSPHCKNFIERGGDVESVLATIIDCTMEQDDIIGDGEYLADCDYASEEGEEHKIYTLPVCRNDREWGFVKGMLLSY